MPGFNEYVAKVRRGEGRGARESERAIKWRRTGAKRMEEGATRGPCPKDLTTRVLSEIRSQHKFDTVDFSNDRGDPHLATDVVLKKLEPLVMVKYGPFLGSCCPLTSKSNSNLSSLPPPPAPDRPFFRADNRRIDLLRTDFFPRKSTNLSTDRPIDRQ